MSPAANKAIENGGREDAPLLANDALDGNESDDGETVTGDQGKARKSSSWSQRTWHWVRNNLMIVFIVLLLTGGVVALCVYFAGMM